MRPAGEISLALLKAARDLARQVDGQRKGATLAELAARACVSKEVATDRVKKLKSRGRLEKVGERRVAYRNRPVVEYAPAVELSIEDVQVMTGPAVLGNCLQNWIR